MNLSKSLIFALALCSTANATPDIRWNKEVASMIETARFDSYSVLSKEESAGVSNTLLASNDDFDDFDEFEETSAANNEPIYDPLEGYNRAMFKFNDGFYEWIVRPMARGYEWLVPQGVRISISKFFHNLMFPLRFVNNLLQFKGKGAMTELGRFVVNTTFGVAGFFDPADHYFGWLPHEEDFGQTLAFYGVGAGPPIVIPFLGHSNLRDGITIFPNYLVHPVYHLAGYEEYLATQVVDYFNFISLHYPQYDSMKRDALDTYTFLRDAYRQNRLKQIEE